MKTFFNLFTLSIAFAAIVSLSFAFVDQQSILLQIRFHDCTNMLLIPDYLISIKLQ